MASKKRFEPEAEEVIPEVEKPLPVAPAPVKTVETPAPSPQASLPAVTIEVFSKVCGLKADQVAGFKAWVKVQKLGPCTIPDWHKAMEKYANRPV